MKKQVIAIACTFAAQVVQETMANALLAQNLLPHNTEVHYQTIGGGGAAYIAPGIVFHKTEGDISTDLIVLIAHSDCDKVFNAETMLAANALNLTEAGYAVSAWMIDDETGTVMRIKIPKLEEIMTSRRDSGHNGPTHFSLN